MKQLGQQKESNITPSIVVASIVRVIVAEQFDESTHYSKHYTTHTHLHTHITPIILRLFSRSHCAIIYILLCQSNILFVIPLLFSLDRATFSVVVRRILCMYLYIYSNYSLHQTKNYLAFQVWINVCTSGHSAIHTYNCRQRQRKHSSFRSTLQAYIVFLIFSFIYFFIHKFECTRNYLRPYNWMGRWFYVDGVRMMNFCKYGKIIFNSMMMSYLLHLKIQTIIRVSLPISVEEVSSSYTSYFIHHTTCILYRH